MLTRKLNLNKNLINKLHHKLKIKVLEFSKKILLRIKNDKRLKKIVRRQNSNVNKDFFTDLRYVKIVNFFLYIVTVVFILKHFLLLSSF